MTLGTGQLYFLIRSGLREQKETFPSVIHCTWQDLGCFWSVVKVLWYLRWLRFYLYFNILLPSLHSYEGRSIKIYPIRIFFVNSLLLHFYPLGWVIKLWILCEMNFSTKSEEFSCEGFLLYQLVTTFRETS